MANRRQSTPQRSKADGKKRADLQTIVVRVVAGVIALIMIGSVVLSAVL